MTTRTGLSKHYFTTRNSGSCAGFILRYDDTGRVVEETQTTEMEEALPAQILAELNPSQLEAVKTIFGVGEGGQRWKRVLVY
jgi:hypothetical protein